MNVSCAASCPCVVHLLHSASGLTLNHVASPETRVDVGTIAAHFSLQPNSVRFNGYFISMDANFISGLTWYDLLTFFQSRGCNWGSQPYNPVEVQGRPLPPQASCAGGLASNPEGVCHDKSLNAKRLALQFRLVSPSKRTKRERDSDLVTQSSLTRKIKRGVLADEFLPCTWNKRVRHEINPGEWECAGESQGEAICGSKRQRPSDNVCTERSLWKRLKEVKV